MGAKFTIFALIKEIHAEYDRYEYEGTDDGRRNDPV